MVTETKERRPQDLTLINIEEEWEVRWWSVRFNTTPEAVRTAVAEVGPSAQEVEKRLKEAAGVAFKLGGED